MSVSWKNVTEVEQRLLRGIRTLVGENDALLLQVLNPRMPKLRARPGIIRDDCWHLNYWEELQVQAALDIWSGGGHLPLWACLESWDERRWAQFIAAICIVKCIDLKKVEALVDHAQA